MITASGTQAAPIPVARLSAQQYTGDVIEARGPVKFFGQTLDELQRGGIKSYSAVPSDGSLPLPPILREAESLQAPSQSELRGTWLIGEEVPQSAKSMEGPTLSTSPSPAGWPHNLPSAFELPSSQSNTREPAQVIGFDGVVPSSVTPDQTPITLSATAESSVAEALLSMLKQPRRKRKSITSSILDTSASSNTEKLRRIGKSMVDSHETPATAPGTSKANLGANGLPFRKGGRPRIHETAEDSQAAKRKQELAWSKDQIARNTPFALDRRRKQREAYARKRAAELSSRDEVSTSGEK